MALYEASNSPIQQGIETYMRNKQFNLSKIPAHEHNGVDTVYISAVNLPAGTPVLLGLGGLVSISNTATAMPGTAGELIQTSLISGKDVNGAVIGTQTNNLQFNLIHYPQSALNQSFVTAMRPPIFEQIPTSAISITAGGNTVTITDYSFIELIIAFSIIILVVPQTPTENIVLRKLLETGFFTNYVKAKDFLNKTTWFLIFLFLVLLIALNSKVFF